jgi:hypothetical protein
MRRGTRRVVNPEDAALRKRLGQQARRALRGDGFVTLDQLVIWAEYGGPKLRRWAGRALIELDDSYQRSRYDSLRPDERELLKGAAERARQRAAQQTETQKDEALAPGVVRPRA